MLEAESRLRKVPGYRGPAHVAVAIEHDLTRRRNAAHRELTPPSLCSRDMGGVSPDGGTLWVSRRYSSAAYAISTRTGRIVASIRVGVSPHGLCVWPQPGRYSTGHTGVMR